MKTHALPKLLLLLLTLCLAVAVFAACNEDDVQGAIDALTEQSGGEQTGTEQTGTEQGQTPTDTTPAGDNTQGQTQSGGGQSTPAAQMPDLTAAQLIGAPDFAVEGQTLSLTLPNATETYSFVNRVTVSEGATWQICTDTFGMNPVITRTVPLTAGNNTYYLFVISGDGQTVNSYTITIRRKPMYTVLFNTTGGTAVDSQQVEEGNLATRPTAVPDRTGYTFVDWNYDFSKPITAAQTITANWQPITYNITYTLNDGTNAAANPAAYTIESANISLQYPTRAGYTFTGWTYEGQTTPTATVNIPHGSTGDKAYTANWLADAYSITYTMNGGINAVANPAAYTIESADISLQQPTRAGYTFAGWTYEGQDTPTLAATIPHGSTGAKAYIANWQVDTYTIMYDVNGGESVANPTTYRITDDVTLAQPTRENYRFMGWYTAGNVQITNLQGNYGDLNLTAAWESYFTRNGGTITGLTDYAKQNVTALTIPASIDGTAITSIGEGAFSNCTGLTSVTIGNGVTSIGASAFRGCSSLERITIPFVGNRAGVTASDTYQCPLGYLFGTSSYTGGTATTQYFYGSSTSSTTNTTYYIPTTLRSVTVTGGNILLGAFYNCSGLTSITIPNGITSIGSNAFGRCTGLTSVTIPNSVTSIGIQAFYGCSGLQSITIPFVGNRTGVTASDTYQYPLGYLFGTSSYTGGTATTQYYYGSSTSSTTNTTYYIPATLRSVTVTGGNIFYGAFYNCTGLTSVTIGNGVTSIGSNAFYNCTDLTSITIPDSVTSIGDYAFQNCSGLTSVTFAENSQLTSIGGSAFYNCTGLTSITIPDSVTTIDECAFSFCTGLTSITIPDSVTSIGGNAFENCSKLTYNTYNNAQYIGNPQNPYIVLIKAVDTSISSCTIHGNTKSVQSGAFQGCTGLTSITIPSSVTSIGGSAFRGCTGLTSITIPDSVTSIGSSAFSGCTGLTSITIPDSVTSIGSSAFSGCTGLTSITIPDGVTSIGNEAFSGCTYLTSVTIGNGVMSIGEDAFAWCGSLTSITIGNGVTSIGNYAFYGCAGLTSITIPDSVTSIGERAFSGCRGLTSITIPDSVTSIGSDAFSNCTGLTSVTIPDSVTSMGDWAFKNCTGLTSVTIGNGVTSIGSSAFSDCYKLVEVYNKSALTITKGSTGNGYLGYYAKDIYTAPYTSKLSTDENGYIIYTNGATKSLIGYTGTETILTLPSDITEINCGAFYNCTGLTSITIPKSVTSIGNYAFYCCTGLTSVTFANTSGWYCTETKGASSGTNMTVTNASTNATNLKSYYRDYYWYRK